MPLKEIDPTGDVSDAEHQRMDEAIYADAGGPERPPLLHFALLTIVTFDSRLNQKYTHCNHARELLVQYPELASMLEVARGQAL